ncbi:hypothetical protein L9F63_002116, partial [Diploptera punctata]
KQCLLDTCGLFYNELPFVRQEDQVLSRQCTFTCVHDHGCCLYSIGINYSSESKAKTYFVSCSCFLSAETVSNFCQT